MASSELGFAPQATIGELFGTPDLKTARVLTCDLDAEDSDIKSAEVSARNQTAAALSPVIKGVGGCTSELQYPNENGNWLHLVLGSLFRKDVIHLDLTGGSAITSTFDAGAKTVTASSGAPFANVPVGAWLAVKSPLNDWVAKVTARTDTVLTFPGATVVTEAGVSTQVAGSYAENGDTLKLLKAERRAADHYLQFSDLVASQWNVTLSPRSVIQSNFTFIGGDVGANNTRLGTLGSAGNMTPITTGDRFVQSYLLRNGVSDPNFKLTSFNFTCSPNPQEKPVLYLDGVDGYDNGEFAVNGSFELWASDKAYFDIAKSGLSQSIGFAVKDVADNFIIYEFPSSTWRMPKTPASGGTAAFKSTINFDCTSTSEPLVKVHFVPKLT